MPDRPCTAEQLVQPHYREDTPDAVGATGKAQLLVFFGPGRTTNAAGRPDCLNCERIRPMLQQLEAEYWGKIDFVYINMDNLDNEDYVALMEVYEIIRVSPTLTSGNFSKPNLFFLLPEGDILRRFHTGGGIGDELDEVKESSIRYSLDKYLLEQAQE